MDQLPVVGERSRFDEMVGDVFGTHAEATGLELLERVGDAGVQSLLTGGRDAGKESLTHKFVTESEGPLGPLRAWDDDSHLLGFFDDREELVDVYLAYAGEQLEAKT